MRTIQLTLYRFEELSAESRERAVSDHLDFNVNHAWWEYIYLDAEAIGLKINSFDIDRANYCDAAFIHDAPYTSRQVLLNHGERTQTYFLTQACDETCSKLLRDWPKDEIGEYEQSDLLDTALANIEEDYLNGLSKAYLRLLAHEYDHLTSDKAIADSLTANEYWFTADGKMATRLEKLAALVNA